jgi:hypothetical protein
MSSEGPLGPLLATNFLDTSFIIQAMHRIWNQFDTPMCGNLHNVLLSSGKGPEQFNSSFLYLSV